MEIQLEEFGSKEKGVTAILLLGDLKTCKSLVESLKDNFKIYLLTTPLPDSKRIELFASDLKNTLLEKRIRRLMLVGVGYGANLAQELAIKAERIVRRLVLVEPLNLYSDGSFSRVLNRLEKLIPTGLPLRGLSDDYDSRSFLHRIHCPTLILNSTNTKDYSAELLSRISNSWSTEIVSPDLKNLPGAIQEFSEVSIKRPQ